MHNTTHHQLPLAPRIFIFLSLFAFIFSACQKENVAEESNAKPALEVNEKSELIWFLSWHREEIHVAGDELPTAMAEIGAQDNGDGTWEVLHPTQGKVTFDVAIYRGVSDIGGICGVCEDQPFRGDTRSKKNATCNIRHDEISYCSANSLTSHQADWWSCRGNTGSGRNCQETYTEVGRRHYYQPGCVYTTHSELIYKWTC